MNEEQKKKPLAKYLAIGLAIIVISVAAILIAVNLTNNKKDIFTVNTVNQIALGSSQEKVISILGEPKDKSENDNAFLYYKKSDKTGDYIEVVFDNGLVKEVFLDKDHGGGEKKQTYVSLEKSEVQLSENICNIQYTVRYTDGSFYRGRGIADIVNLTENISGSKIDIAWKSKLGQTCSDTVFVSNENNMIFGKNCYILNNALTITANDFDLSKIIQSNYDFRKVEDIIISDKVWRLNFTSNKTDFALWSGLKNVYYNGDLNSWCNLLFDISPLEYADHLYIDNQLVKNVVIDDTIESISDKAFAHCKSIQTLTINNPNVKIGNQAFQECSNLKNITFQTNVNSLGERIFDKCDNIESARVPLPVIESFDTEKITEIVLFGEGIIPQSIFENCEKLKSVQIEGNITEISERAFFGCTELTEIHFTESLERIGARAFENCAKAEINLSLPNLKNIGDTAFYGCTALQSVTFYQGIKEIGEYAFQGCENIADISIPNSLETIGIGTFNGCNNIEKMTLPFTGLNCDGDFITNFYAIFGEAEDVPQKLKHVELTGSSLFEYAFDECKYIRKITLPDGILTIPEYAFSGCASLVQIDIPDSVITIEQAFSGCKSLITLVIPKNVRSVSNNAFFGANKLIEIRNLSQIIIPTNSTIKNVYSELADKKTIEDDGFVFYNDNGNYSLIGYIGDKTDLILPETIDGHNYTLYKDTFRNAISLKSVVIPNVFTSLIDGMFADCIALESVTLPQGITELPLWIFQNCTSLKSVVIPHGVTTISQHAFNGCGSLKSVNLPDTVIYIGLGAFFQCDALETVNYTGSEEQWNSIFIVGSEIGGNNLPLEYADKNFNCTAK